MRNAVLFWSSLVVAGCGGSGAPDSPPSTATDTRPEPVIEEPDLYKRDGNLLYVQNPATGLNIIDMSDERKPVIVGRAPLAGGAGAEIFLQPAQLVVVMLKSASDRCTALSGLDGGGWPAGAEVALVDTTTRSKPALLGRYCVPGSLVASRTVDQVLYLVTTNPDANGTGSRAWSLRLDDARHPVVAGQMEFPGASREIVVSAEAIVVASHSSVDADGTRVQYISIAGDGTMKPRGFFDVDGVPQGRFHMDLRGTQFRIVTYSTRSAASRMNILDVSKPDAITLLGELANIAPGERLYATRFDGDRAYVVTFRRIDPLWIISLANPARPAVVGEVQVPGWSDFVFPRGDRLITIGRDIGGVVALSLFDVTDPVSPVAIDQTQVAPFGATSEANADYRGLTIVDDAATWLAVPVNTTAWSTDDVGRTKCDVKSFVQVVDVGSTPGGLFPRGRIEQQGPVRRSYPAGDGNDRLVTISDYELESIDATSHAALHADATLTVGDNGALGASVKEVCDADQLRQMSERRVYACTVAPGRSRPWGTVLLVAAALLVARRRRHHA